MEGNEMNVFSQHSDQIEKEENFNDNISRQNKGVFGHFVEESTLRNVSLDELEELSDVGCVSDGNIRNRTPSSVSSEQPVRIAILVEWNKSYITSSEGLLRLGLLVCSSISLACVTSAGDTYADVLDMPFSSSVRAHIFVTVLAFFYHFHFLYLKLPQSLKSFPSFGMLLNVYFEWAKLQLSLAAVFGFLATFVCVPITIIRSCANKPSSVPEDIVLTSLRSS